MVPWDTGPARAGPVVVPGQPAGSLDWSARFRVFRSFARGNRAAAATRLPLVLAVFLLINRLARRERRRLLALAAVLLLASAVAIAHSATSGDHMGSGAVMCVAVLQVAAVAAAARAPRALLPVRWSSIPLPGPRLALLVCPPEPRARAGPAALQVFRL